MTNILNFSNGVISLFQIAYGRDYDNTAEPLWSESSGPPKSGQGGNWNFLEEIEVDVELPKRHIHNAALEVINISPWIGTCMANQHGNILKNSGVLGYNVCVVCSNKQPPCSCFPSARLLMLCLGLEEKGGLY